MLDIRTEKRLINFVIWLFAGLVLLVILTSCSGYDPYAALQIAATSPATAAPGDETDRPAQIATPTDTQQSAQVCQVLTGIPAGKLNMRTGAGMQYAVIRVISEGETLTVTKAGAWLQVIDQAGARGYVYSKYCKVKP